MSNVLWCHLDLPFFGLIYLFSSGRDSYCVYVQASLTVLLYVRTQSTDLL